MQAAAKNLTPCVLELGGKSPCIVDKSADIDVAARRIVWGKCINAGQTCIAPDYLFVHSSIKAQLLDRMRYYITKFFGDKPEKSDHLCHIVSDKAMTRLTSYADVVHDLSTRYIAPTILDNISSDHPIMQEEIFGPILPVMQFDDIFEVEQYVNSHEKPLAFYYFGREKDGWNLINRTTSGGACINDVLMHISNSNLPFGGVGNSGIGKYHRYESFLAFSNRRAVLATPTWFDLPVKFPPFKGLDLFKEFLK
jgi:aldehyde dehydrogenase (NAD+)